MIKNIAKMICKHSLDLELYLDLLVINSIETSCTKYELAMSVAPYVITILLCSVIFFIVLS